ncbi:DUF6468 domain-containing protein [Methylobacterium persicinum]|uniref:DUF6468 domain-containing protein n=1 Tax=Methylobacterium persicinum TaxID=374426 RepID=A0ABU0HK58_9HYPH|nr:DUF6468 domain-containing protein [Methylobacterium persicinum]MDQ0442105.1 hypothetical protein [Methylobacterium persicinum]GJE38796.1 hypothetical protein KHHGKMAE_2871 [Methylobacterium persicinum]
MSLFVTVATDLLVAVLLAATIVTSLRLSKRIGQLKGDEAALRSTIGDLMVATNNAERAIIGLRNALDECDRNLADRIQSAQACTTTLAGGVEAGEAVLTRIAAIVSGARSAAVAPRPVEVRSEPQAEAPERPAPVAASEGPNGERLGAAAAAALAMTERALARVRARAA